MSSETYQLAVLLTLRDMASSGLNRFLRDLRATSQAGRQLAQSIESIQDELNKGIAISGAGVGGLALFGKGVKASANFQSSMTDLRTTLTEVGKDGKVNFDALGKDMLKAEGIAMKLGNQLPGTTQDFVQMMQVLKQNGVQVESIFSGTAEAVANLAVANDQVPKDVAKSYAQFRELFKLRPEDDKAAADVMSRLYTSSGINADELIQATKYFQGRSGSALNISGLKGAEETLRIFGLLKKQGLEGSEAGTALNNLFSGYISAQNKKNSPLEKLKAQENIDLKFFDEKGQFGGFDNIFKQLEPLRKLSDEKRTTYLKEIFGEEGMSAATAFMKTGADGWQKFNEGQNQTISLTDKNAEKSKDFNNQMEALTGTLENLKVTVFEPMLPSLTSGVKSLNEMVGGMQKFAKENPTIASMVSGFLGIGSAGLIVAGGIKTAYNAYKLLRIAMTASSANNLLTQAQSQANGATNSISNATSRVGRFRGALQNFANSGLGQIGATIAITYSINKIGEYLDVAKQAGESQTTAFNTINQGAIIWSRFVEDLASQNKKPTEQDYELQANTTLSNVMGLGLKNALPSEFFKKPFYSWSKDSQLSQVASETFLYPISSYYGTTNPFSSFGGNANYKEGFQKTAPLLSDPNIMMPFIRALESRLQIPGEREPVMKGLQEAFPDSYAQAMQQLNQQSNQLAQNFSNLSTNMLTQQGNLNQFGQQQVTAKQNFNSLMFPMVATEKEFMGMPSPMQKTQQSVLNLSNSANQVPSPLNSLSSSATSASSSLDNLALKIGNFQMPTPQVQTFSLGIPSTSGTSTQPSIFNLGKGYADGGRVRTKGLAYIHADEEIIPANVVGKYESDLGKLSTLVGSFESRKNESKTAGNQASVINFSPTINISGDSGNVKKEVEEALKSAYQQFEARLTRELRRGRERA